MEPDTASFWLDVLAAGAGGLWLLGLWFVARTRRLGSEPLQGEAEVAKDPAAVMARLARALADARRGSVLQSSIVATATGKEVQWNSTGVFRHRGVATARGDARRCHVAWQIHCGRWLQHVALVVVVVGGLVVGTLYYALHEFAVTSENPAVRAQVVQMVQAIHVLWPPFLFAGLSRKLRSAVGDEVARIVQNAPFAAAG